MGGQARVHLARGDLDTAMSLLVERERLCREAANDNGLAAALGDQAIILRIRGELDTAVDRHGEQERFARQAGNPRLIAAALNGQAGILITRGKLRRADPLLEQWRHTWWEFANDEERRRWTLGVSLTEANRRIVRSLKPIIILAAGCFPIGDIAGQVSGQIIVYPLLPPLRSSSSAP